MLKKIAVIDPVGAKSGMNSYDSALANGFSTNDIEVRIYSNFTLVDGSDASIVSKHWFTLERANSLRAVAILMINFVRSLVDCKVNGVRWIVLHQFNTNLVTFSTFVLAKIFFMRVVNIVHDLNSLGNDDVKIFRKIILNRFSDVLCVQNQTVESELSLLVSEESKRQMFRAPHVSYMDVVNTEISSSDARKNLNLHEQKTYVLFFGQIKKQKGLSILIEAMASLPSEVILIVAGKPWKDEVADYHQQVLELNLNDRIIFDSKYISDYSRDMYFAAVDLIVLPYTEIYESGVLRMAMDFGVPVVASDITVLASQVSAAKCGVMFKAGDSADLSKTMNEFLANDTGLASAGKNGKAYSHNTSNAKYISKLFLDKINSATYS